MTSCNKVIEDQNHRLVIPLEIENDELLGKRFQWKPNHPLVEWKVKTTMRVTTKQKEPIQEEEEEGKMDFLASYIEVKEETRQINEEKDPEWMDAQIETK